MSDYRLHGDEFLFHDNGETCFVPGVGTLPFWRVWAEQGYEPHTIWRILRLVRPGDLFVDVGAWVGAFTLLAASRGARVIAFEPDDKSFYRLTRNVAANHFEYEPLLIHAACVHSADLGEGFVLVGGDGVTRLLPSRAATVDCVTFEGPLEGETPEFVKIDVEGYETRLMQEVGPMLYRLGVPVQVSLHGEALAPKCLAGFKTVIHAHDLHGDLLALPFATFDRAGWS